MGYRKLEPKKKPIKRVFQDTTVLNRTFVQNGVRAHIAIPCWYLEVRHPQHTHYHDRDYHDHIGWPDPKHPDHSCQDAYHIKHPHWKYDRHLVGWHHPHRYLDMSNCFPIHLSKEGYTKVTIAFDNKPEGLIASGYIDEDQDWVVCVDFYPMCSAAIKEDIEVPYTVFLDGTFTTGKQTRQVRDIVAKGILRIVRGPIN